MYSGAWAVGRVWRRMPAAGRAWLWWLVCLKLTVGLLCLRPVALPVLPHAPSARPAPPSLSSPALPAVLVPISRPNGKIITASFHGPAAQPLALPPPPSLSWVTALYLFWLAGVSGLLTRDARRWWLLQRHLQGLTASEALTAEARRVAGQVSLSHVPRVAERPWVTGPLVAGLCRPVILLPTTPVLSAEERAMAMAHEMAHLRRGDLWLGLIPSLAETLFFAFPPVRWAVREYYLAREEACDAGGSELSGVAQEDAEVAGSKGALVLVGHDVPQAAAVLFEEEGELGEPAGVGAGGVGGGAAASQPGHKGGKIFSPVRSRGASRGQVTASGADSYEVSLGDLGGIVRFAHALLFDAGIMNSLLSEAVWMALSYSLLRVIRSNSLFCF